MAATMNIIAASTANILENVHPLEFFQTLFLKLALFPSSVVNGENVHT
jgi:hypothetical protein